MLRVPEWVDTYFNVMKWFYKQFLLQKYCLNYSSRKLKLPDQTTSNAKDILAIMVTV